MRASRHAPSAPTRADPRRHVLAYLKALLDQTERKRDWQLVEEAGARFPDGMKRLLIPAHWDADTVRGDLMIAYVRKHLALCLAPVIALVGLSGVRARQQ